MPEGSFGGGGNSVATLYYEYRTTWILEDPTAPHSKTNGRRASYGEGGFWFRLHFYRGRWRGAAFFFPIEFGDLKLWFQYGHGGDASVIAAVTAVLREENMAFCRLHPWQRPNPLLRRTAPEGSEVEAETR